MKRVVTIAVITLVFAGAFYFFGVSSPAARITYLTEAVETGKLQETISATGTVHAVLTVNVGSQVSGRIEEVLVDFNDEVRQEQPLARLDPHSFNAKVNGAKAALNRAKASVKIREAGVERARGLLANAEAQLPVFEARISRAQGAFDEARATRDRNNALAEKGLVSRDDLDQIRTAFVTTDADLRAARAELDAQRQRVIIAQAELRQAEAELLDARSLVPEREASLELAQVELERTIIRSPIDGMVLDRVIEPGQTVAASLEAPKLFSIARNLEKMEVHASIDEADIGKIEQGQRVVFGVDSFPGKRFAGEVVQVRKAPQVSQNVVTYTVLVSTDNPDLLLLPGMTATMQFVVAESAEVLKIPNAALRFQPPFAVSGNDGAISSAGASAQGGGVPATAWLPGADGRPLPVPIHVGMTDASSTEVLEGTLKSGDEVVVGYRTDNPEAGWFGLRLGF